jgi:hypothetical protein
MNLDLEPAQSCLEIRRLLLEHAHPLVLLAPVRRPPSHLPGFTTRRDHQHDCHHPHPAIIGQRPVRVKCSVSELKYRDRMRRSSIALMFAGTGGALLVALFLLWRSTRGEAQPAGEPIEAPPAEIASEQVAPVPGPTGPTPRPAARVGKVGSTPSAPASRGASGPAPALTAAPDQAESDDPMSNTENLHFGGTQLRAQNAAVEPKVRECVDKVVAAGGKPTGTAVLTYVVAKKGDTYEVEDTSYDSDETTLTNPGLVECLHRTAKEMSFVGLPRRAHALVVTRRVKLEAGAVTEYKHVGFSYLR